MADTKRAISSVLLVAGVVLVFAGLSAALGFTAGGAITSLAAIVMLLYAGAVWFGRATPPAVQQGPAGPMVFDRGLQVVCGAGQGTALIAQFPETLHDEIRRHCAAALAGQSGRFTCDYGATRVAFDAVPVRASDGSVVYGMLLSSAGGPAALDEARAREAGHYGPLSRAEVQRASAGQATDELRAASGELRL